MEIVARVHSLQQLGDYWRLLWELSASCPVPYLNKDALPNHLVDDQQSKLLDYEFELLVDGVKLFKPVSLHANPGGYTTFSINSESKRVYGNTVRFSGYILVQEGAQLRPDELRGIMVRIKNIGIGYYDPSMLDYRFNEGPRSRWLTGEIWVEEGLENALNIDRDSFNRFHPEFRVIQEYIHRLLHERIFPETYKKIDLRSAQRAESREASRISSLEEIVSRKVEVPVRIRQESEVAHPVDLPSIQIAQDQDQCLIDLPALDVIKTRRPFRQLAGAILALYEIAQRETSKDKSREVFTELLLQLLREW